MTRSQKLQKLKELVRTLFRDDNGRPFEMTDGQAELFDAIYSRRKLRVQFECATQYGKELADDTPVMTSMGWKSHGELAVGDSVFAPDGRQVKILEVHEPSEDDDHEVTFSNGDRIVCHARHEWMVWHRAWGEYRIRETRDLRKYAANTFKLPQITPLRFDETALPIEPYDLGVWLGDGVTGEPAITMSPDDRAVIDAMHFKPSSTAVHSKTGVCRYTFWRCGFMDGLRSLGLTGGKHVPDLYKTTSVRQRLELLAGIIDTDGTVNKPYRENGWRNGRVYIINTNKRLIDDFSDIIRSLGMRVSVTKVKATVSSSGIVGKKDCYYLGFKPIVDIPTKIPRKKITVQPNKRRLSIVGIKTVQPKRGRCITVEGGMYLAGRTMIPTHNSEVVSMAVLLRACTFPERWIVLGGSADKARIIMKKLIKHVFENEYCLARFDVGKDESLERIKRERSKDRLTFKVTDKGDMGEVMILSADSRRKGEDAGDILVGHGTQNLIMDDAALIPDNINAKAMRMLGGHRDGFLLKITNSLRRNHAFRSRNDPAYDVHVIDWRRAVAEGRYAEAYIDEMRKVMDPYLFGAFYDCVYPPSDAADDEGWMPLLSDDTIQAAQSRAGIEPFGPVRMGCDIGEGRNYTVAVTRTDNVARLIDKRQEPDLMATANWIAEKVKDRTAEAERMFIDAIGIGAGVVSRLREKRLDVVGVKSGEKATQKKPHELEADPVEFTNLKAEMAWKAKRWVEQGGALSPSPDWAQLSKIRYRESNLKRIEIMPKERMRLNGLMGPSESPDVADALFLTFAPEQPKFNMAASEPLKPYFPELGV